MNKRNNNRTTLHYSTITIITFLYTLCRTVYELVGIPFKSLVIVCVWTQ